MSEVVSDAPQTPEALVFKLAERMIQLAAVATEAEQVISDVRNEMKQILQAMDVLVKPAENQEKSNEESNEDRNEEKGCEESCCEVASTQGDCVQVEGAPV